MNATTHTNGSSRPQLDLDAIRAKLAGARGAHYWRSLEEVMDTPEFQEMLHREFPADASEWADGLSRRTFLKWAAASLALAGLTGCTRPPARDILPYVKQPEQLVPGEPLYYATAMLLDGYATGVLVKSREGHPIKVDGNPDHPAALGRSSVWMQASILDLYDPDRSQEVTHRGDLSSWASLLEELNRVNLDHDHNSGDGLRFLTGTVTSPTLAAQLTELLRRFPRARWHQYEAICRDAVREGARLAFGEVLETHCRFEKAAVVLSLESDFLYLHPQRLRYTRDFIDGRRASAGVKSMNRLYVVESTPTITGAMADHRLALASGDIQQLARDFARQLGAISISGAEPGSSRPPEWNRWLQAVARDLERHRGESVIIAGESQPAEVHALAHALNAALGNLGNTITYTATAEAQPVPQLDSLRELAGDMKAGAVRTLFILGGNPAYTAPADLLFRDLLSRVPCSVHLGIDFNETAACCTWHVPQKHYLESWGDGRAFDGTVSLLQPLIAPLYGGKSASELLAAFSSAHPLPDDYEIVREFWQRKNSWPDFEKGWRRALHDGVIQGSAASEAKANLNRGAIEVAVQRLSPTGDVRSRGSAATRVEVCFRPDASVWDGSFANNGWLQECPRPVSKLTWDNAVVVSPALAQELLLENDDVVELSRDERSVRGPVWIQPGQARDTVTLHLGYGRQNVGRIGRGAGFDAYALRTTDSVWRATGVQLRKVGERRHLVATQTHHNLHNPERQIFRQGTWSQFQSNEHFVKQTIESPAADETLYDIGEHKFEGRQWGMSIDLTTCIGCSACLMACNAENNIPVVGREQVDRNREMHWIRIDTYYQGPLDRPEFNHMPVPCMHCEHAPCELVCPVAATVHDHEGLNVQVYNRCVGTRFCSNNCPYKVRRFNFLWFADYHTPSFKSLYNPEVTVRWRGVMEKCTYCVQRISRARITAQKENRRIHDGEVQTACQQACPADAIVFGDLADANSKVTALKRHPLDYAMLGGLNTRPRTTYLAKLRNPNPEMA